MNNFYDICRMTILCIDDDEQTLEMMRTVLSRNYTNQNLIFVNNAFDALNTTMDTKPDVFIVDLHMPYIDGAKFSETIINRNLEGAVVMMSAYSDLVLSKKCRELGIKHYITKPFDFNKLYEMLDNIMEQIFLKRLIAARALNESIHCKIY